MSRSVNPTALLAGATLTFALTLAWQLADTTILRAGELAVQDQPDAALRKQPQADIDRKSAGCLTCHTPDTKTMHGDTVGARAGCADCHGADPSVMRDKAIAKDSPQ